MSDSRLPRCFKDAEKAAQLQGLMGDLPHVWLEMFDGFRELEDNFLWNAEGGDLRQEVLEVHQRFANSLLRYGPACVEAAQAAGDADQAETITTWLTFVKDSMALWHPEKEIDPQTRTQLVAMFSGDRSEAWGDLQGMGDHALRERPRQISRKPQNLRRTRTAINESPRSLDLR